MIFLSRVLIAAFLLTSLPVYAQTPAPPAAEVQTTAMPPAADPATNSGATITPSAEAPAAVATQPPADAQAVQATGEASAGQSPADASASQSLVDAALNRMSLMFTEDEIEAVKTGKTEEIPSDVAPVDETTQEVTEPEFDPANPPPPIPLNRKIALGGILYRAEGDWIIWLNGQKLGPDNLLPEIQGITVASDKVYLEWFDIGINGIIRLTLRPHQTYDIVTGLLLPGKAG